MTTATATKKTSKKSLSADQVGIKYGFRSGLEERVAADLTEKSVGFSFEAIKIPYTKPESVHSYTPDFVTENGIIVEAKGRYLTEDRQKQLLVKKQNPDLDIRFVFSNSKAKINKRSTTTYADWCSKNGFKYADKLVPQEWLEEPPNEKSLAALKKLQEK